MILQSPKYVHFLEDASAIATDEITPLIAAAFGLPLQKNVKWDGLEELSLFQRPKAIVLLSVSGVPHGRRLDIPHKFHYKTLEEDGVLNTGELVEHIQGMPWKNEPLLVEFSAIDSVFAVMSHHAEVFANLPMTLAALHDDVTADVAPRWFTAAQLQSLNVSQPPDLAFVGQLYMVQEITNADGATLSSCGREFHAAGPACENARSPNFLLENKAAVKTQSPDFFQLSVGGVEQLVKTYGVDSAQLNDALHLLSAVSQRVIGDLRRLYGDDVLVELVTVSDTSHKAAVSRQRRNLLQADSGSGNNPLNLGPQYSQDYPCIFHIFFWSCLGIVLCLWFTSYAIWFMDPNRDSIIYRMTSQRQKRD